MGSSEKCPSAPVRTQETKLLNSLNKKDPTAALEKNNAVL